MRTKLRALRPWIATRIEPVLDWLNVEIGKSFWGYAPRRLDIGLLALGIFCTAYYGYWGGMYGAAMGALTYILVAMCALWIL